MALAPSRRPILQSETEGGGALSGAVREVFARYGLPEAALNEILALLEGI
jgi:hypothetical protein